MLTAKITSHWLSLDVMPFFYCSSCVLRLAEFDFVACHVIAELYLDRDEETRVRCKAARDRKSVV